MVIGPGFRPGLDPERERLNIFSEDTINKLLNRDKTEREAEFEEPEVEVTDDDLKVFDTAETMPVEEFLRLADYSYAKLNQIIKRSETFLKTVKPEAVTIPYDEHLAEMLRNLNMGTITDDTITLSEDEMACLMRTAATNVYENELKDYKPTDVNPTKASAILRSFPGMTKKFFPVWGIRLLLMLFWLFFKLVINKLLRALCRFFGKLPVVGGKIKKAIDKASKWLIHQPSCNRGVDLRYELNKPYVRKRIMNPDWDLSELENGIPEQDENFCESNNPSMAEIETSRNVLKEVFKYELKDPNKVKPVNPEIAAMQRIRADAIQYSVVAGDVIESVRSRPHGFSAPGETAAAVQGGIISIFSTINGIIVGLDKGISALVHLEFMSPRAKDWVCCFVRIFYVLMPLLFRGKDDQDARNAIRHIYEFYKGGKNTQPLIKVGAKERLYLEAFDKILGYLLGSAAINIELEFPFDLDLIMGAIYSSMAEVLALVTNMLYGQIEYNIKSTLSIPEVKALIDMCPPLDYLLTLSVCSINGFYVKIMELLSGVWLKGNTMLKSFEASFDIMITSRNVKLFQNIFKLLANFGAHLSAFCDLNKLTNKYEVEQLLNEIDAQMGGHVEDGHLVSNDGTTLSSQDQEILLNPAFSDPGFVLGPDYDSYSNTELFADQRGGPFPLGFNLADSPIYTRDFSNWSKSTAENVTDDDLETGNITPCGDHFSELIRTTINNINLNK